MNHLLAAIRRWLSPAPVSPNIPDIEPSGDLCDIAGFQTDKATELAWTVPIAVTAVQSGIATVFGTYISEAAAITKDRLTPAPISGEVPNVQPSHENSPAPPLAPAKPKRKRRPHILTIAETPRWYARRPQLSSNAYHDRSGWHEIQYMLVSAHWPHSAVALESSSLPDQLSQAIGVARQHNWCGYVRYYGPDGLYCHSCRYLRIVDNGI